MFNFKYQFYVQINCLANYTLSQSVLGGLWNVHCPAEWYL